MNFLTVMALRRPTVAILAIVLVLVSGVLAYRSMQVELFPQIEFPLVTVFASYPSAGPDAVVRDVTEPIERAIAGADGLEGVRSDSSEGRAAVFARYRYGTDMAAAEAQVQNAVSGLTLPQGVEPPTVGRFNPEAFPVIEFGVVSDRPLLEVQGLVEDLIVPEIEKLDGVLEVELLGGVERNVAVTADLAALEANGVSLFQVSSTLRENNTTLPAGTAVRRHPGGHRQDHALPGLRRGAQQPRRRRQSLGPRASVGRGDGHVGTRDGRPASLAPTASPALPSPC